MTRQQWWVCWQNKYKLLKQKFGDLRPMTFKSIPPCFHKESEHKRMWTKVLHKLQGWGWMKHKDIARKPPPTYKVCMLAQYIHTGLREWEKNIFFILEFYSLLKIYIIKKSEGKHQKVTDFWLLYLLNWARGQQIGMYSWVRN